MQVGGMIQGQEVGPKKQEESRPEKVGNKNRRVAGEAREARHSIETRESKEKKLK
jgi:hypothetical protein